MSVTVYKVNGVLPCGVTKLYVPGEVNVFEPGSRFGLKLAVSIVFAVIISEKLAWVPE